MEIRDNYNQGTAHYCDVDPYPCIHHAHHSNVLIKVHLFPRVISGENVDFSLYDDVRVITGLLKKYLRELPQPVITIDAYSQIMKATGI